MRKGTGEFRISSGDEQKTWLYNHEMNVNLQLMGVSRYGASPKDRDIG